MVVFAICTSVISLAGSKGRSQEFLAGSSRETVSAAIFTNCACCHGRQGQGGFGPPFASNPDLSNTAMIVRQVLGGSEHMPAFRNQLSDLEVADVVSHIRTHFGNQFGSISVAEVRALRQLDKPHVAHRTL